MRKIQDTSGKKVFFTDAHLNQGFDKFISYTDLVTAALLIIQSEQPDTEKSSIPSADNLLLARRLQQAGIDIKAPGDIVREATNKLMGLQTLLKAG